MGAPRPAHGKEGPRYRTRGPGGAACELRKAGILVGSALLVVLRAGERNGARGSLAWEFKGSSSALRHGLGNVPAREGGLTKGKPSPRKQEFAAAHCVRNSTTRRNGLPNKRKKCSFFQSGPSEPSLREASLDAALKRNVLPGAVPQDVRLLKRR